ncbi:SIS domain-containing protein [Marispirochaeta sp.]|uniref:D-sedoheptulose-7-phosphate isomerase n=1 Tax=Marispirochaeta sp. TaxID=2038653 RepID=UPI0029C97492|nr:SIS domain-containing protein [Marispirochaeta sp.]
MDEYIARLITRYPILEPIAETIDNAATLMKCSIDAGGKILVCGNGGSAADADHIVGELMKSFVKKRPLAREQREALIRTDEVMGGVLAAELQGGIPAISLTQHTSLSTAFANDVNSALIYAQQAAVLGKKGDILWGISTSGNAQNVLYAAVCARAMGMQILGLTGRQGGGLKEKSDVCIAVPEDETFMVQELHLPIYHTLCLSLENHLW